MSGLLGFALAYGLYTVERAANGEPTAWAPPPLRPPPLDLPAAACTQEAPNELPGDWTRAAATEHLAREVAAHEQVDLLEVDCAEAPCIAWLRWEDERERPSLTYRWWSLEDAPDASLWTESHTFAEGEGAHVQAVVITPSRPSPDEHMQLQRRVDDGLARLGLDAPRRL
ncbi:MAG: hypothetical protein AAGH15_04130 [Myxococcota bacterium]